MAYWLARAPMVTTETEGSPGESTPATTDGNDDESQIEGSNDEGLFPADDDRGQYPSYRYPR